MQGAQNIEKNDRCYW